MATLYKADGTVEEIEPKNGKSFTLDEMQGYVGGYIEFTALRPMQEKTAMVVNEEGLLRRLPLNTAAMALAGKPIVGDVMVVEIENEGTDSETIR